MTIDSEKNDERAGVGTAKSLSNPCDYWPVIALDSLGRHAWIGARYFCQAVLPWRPGVELPQPPPPGVSMRTTSPMAAEKVMLGGRSSVLPATVHHVCRPHIPEAPPSMPNGEVRRCW